MLTSVGARASKLGRFSHFSIKMKVFPSTNFYAEIIKITAINNRIWQQKTEVRFDQKNFLDQISLQFFAAQWSVYDFKVLR